MVLGRQSLNSSKSWRTLGILWGSLVQLQFDSSHSLFLSHPFSTENLILPLFSTLDKIWKEPGSTVLCLCLFLSRALLWLSEFWEKNYWIKGCPTVLSLPGQNNLCISLTMLSLPFPRSAGPLLRVPLQVMPSRSSDSHTFEKHLQI